MTTANMDPALNFARTMASYNQWMNARLYALAEDIGDEQRKQDLGAFFRSIHGTLNHILLADRVWMGRFTAEPFAVHALDQELYADFDELRVERESLDQRILGWASTLTVDDLAGDLRYKPITHPQARVLPMWLAVMHFFNHQTHHRGQITTLFSQLGIDAGVTDLPYMPR